MANLDFNEIKTIYLIGIGGISMSAIAKILLNLEKNVLGSNLENNDEVKSLKKMGVEIHIPQKYENITKDIDLVVFTGAIKEDNPEFVRAKELNLKMMERSEFLGEICKLYKNVIAIAGTHGKTTTTALIGEIFIKAKLNPTIHLGGEGSFGNVLIGDNNYFITEACEYRESFKYIKGETFLITNIEADHLDYYKSLNEIKIAFNNFANNSNRFVVTFDNLDLKLKKEINQYTCGFNSKNDFYAYNIQALDFWYTFDVKFEDDFIGRFTTKLIGFHNLKNVLCAIAVCYLNNVEISAIMQGVYEFKGVKRRYENIGNLYKVPVIADYAHHPSEIENSLAGFKKKKILCVFQPHTYSRTKTLLKDFSKAFLGAKCVMFYKTYPAREKLDLTATESVLFRKCKNKVKKVYLEENELILNIKKEAKNYDVVLILGAGNIYDIVKKKLFKK